MLIFWTYFNCQPHVQKHFFILVWLCCDAVATDRLDRIPSCLAHKLAGDVRRTRGRRAEDTVKTVADVEDVPKYKENH